MTKPTTQGERLIKIETLMLAKQEADGIRDAAMFKVVDEMRADLKAIRKELDDDKAELDRLKNRGAGILIGVSVAAGGIGAGFGHFWQWLTKLAGG